MTETDTPTVAVTGATGRMGRTVLQTATERPGVEVVGAVTRDPAVETVAGVAVDPATDLPALLSTTDADAVIDFTAPDAAASHAETAADAGAAFVTGTTGFEDRTALWRAAETVPVVHARNFAPGAAVLRALAERAAARLPSYDVEVVETHHAGKRDAPSGTARGLVEAVEEGHTPDDGGLQRVHGREGTAPRTPDEVGVHAVRAGTVTGEHTVLFAGAGEQVRLEHSVGDRGAFAAGALRAAEAVVDGDPGLYGPEVVR